MGKWHADYATECGHEVYVHEDWDGPPRFCKECKEENDAKWYDVSCQDCGATIHAHRDWDHEPRFCQKCKAERDAKWYDKECEGCGQTIPVCRDWDTAPRFCKSCKARHDANWYSKSCEGCGTEIRVCRDWEKVPKFCKACKERNDAKWYDRDCQKCGLSFPVNRDWDPPPEYCKSCKDKYPPVYQSCAHCGETFEISTITQIRCAIKDWDLPRRCKKCRELFSHKPFRTVKEEDLTGGIVFRTYNSLDQLISESRKEKGIWGQKVKHTGKFGKDIGTTYVKGGVLGQTETRRPDGSLKSTSYDSDFMGQKYRKSESGSSDSTRTTTRKKAILGTDYSETE